MQNNMLQQVELNLNNTFLGEFLHGTVHSSAGELSQPRESVPMNSSFQRIDSNIAF